MTCTTHGGWSSLSDLDPNAIYRYSGGDKIHMIFTAIIATIIEQVCWNSVYPSQNNNIRFHFDVTSLFNNFRIFETHEISRKDELLTFQLFKTFEEKQTWILWFHDCRSKRGFYVSIWGILCPRNQWWLTTTLPPPRRGGGGRGSCNTTHVFVL